VASFRAPIDVLVFRPGPRSRAHSRAFVLIATLLKSSRLIARDAPAHGAKIDAVML
jgi:hypothetical protein